MNKKTILVVDDESVNISVLVEILSDKYNILVSLDGKTALDILDSQVVDIILLDIVMPNMDGYEVAHKIIQNEKIAKIPFIFLTSKNNSNDITKGFQAGAVDYISKPFAKEELLARVDNHLQHYNLKVKLSDALVDLQAKIEESDIAKKEFEAIFNHSLNGIALADLDTNFLLVNDAYVKITGLSKEELLATNCISLTEDIKQEQSKRMIKRVLDIGHVENYKKKCITSKRVFYVNISITLMPDKKTLLFNTVDVTKLNIAEKKISQYINIMDKNIISSSTDLDGVVVDASDALLRLTGYAKDELIGKKHSILRSTDTKDFIYKTLWDTIISDNIWEGEFKNIKKDGSFYWVSSRIFPLFDDQNNKIGYMAISHNITDKKASEKQQLEIQQSNERLERLFNHQRNIIAISDGKTLKMANKAMCNFFGISKIEEFTRFYKDISDKFMDINDYFSLAKVPKDHNWIKSLEPLLGDERIVAMHDLENNPHAFSVSISNFDGDDFIISLTDISSTMIEKIQLSKKVTHDKLTGALNREFFENNIVHILNNTTHHCLLGLSILDIDLFKNVNDTYGHLIGDSVLKELTSIVTSSIRSKDYFIRWGGEEFILLIESSSKETLNRALEHIRQRIQHHKFSVVESITCSFGGTLYKVGEDINKTIEKADKALYIAKKSGRNRVELVIT